MAANEVLIELKRRRWEYQKFCDGLVLSRSPPPIVIDGILAEGEPGLPSEAWKEHCYDLLLERLLTRLYAEARPQPMIEAVVRDVEEEGIIDVDAFVAEREVIDVDAIED
jgi:hypothetical protein